MSDYALGNSGEEARRLMRQAEFLAPHTRRTLQAAGVGPGTRVLDLGAGMGDVSLLAAELGATVVGVERDPASIERARARVAGKPIQLVQGTIPELAVDGMFDVICGRLILIYLPDPAAAIRQLAERHLAPGGSIAFVEYDMRPGIVLPTPALARRSMETMSKIFRAAGCNPDIGFELPRVFAAAGFAPPALDVMLWSGAREDDVGHEMIQGVLSSLRPIAERVGLVHEVDPDLATLADRMRAAVRAEGMLVGPAVVGATSRKLA